MVPGAHTQTNAHTLPPATHRTPPAHPGLGRAPARHRVDEITVKVRRLRGDLEGKIALTPVSAPWWTKTAGNQRELAAFLNDAYVEVECASYARWKGQRPEGAELGGVDDDEPTPTLSQQVPAPSRLGVGWRQQQWRSGGNHREQHPADWTPLPDGRWESPKGRRFNPDTDMVQRVIRRRLALNLPITPTDGTFDLSPVAELLGKAAADAGCSPHEWLCRTVRDLAPAQIAGTPTTPTPVAAVKPVDPVDLDTLPTPVTMPGGGRKPARRRLKRVPQHTRKSDPVPAGQVSLFDVEGDERAVA